jgi:hypothetical protein
VVLVVGCPARVEVVVVLAVDEVVVVVTVVVVSHSTSSSQLSERLQQRTYSSAASLPLSVQALRSWTQKVFRHP